MAGRRLPWPAAGSCHHKQFCVQRCLHSQVQNKRNMLTNSIGHAGSECTSGSKLAHDVGTCALHAEIIYNVSPREVNVSGHVLVQWVLMLW